MAREVSDLLLQQAERRANEAETKLATVERQLRDMTENCDQWHALAIERKDLIETLRSDLRIAQTSVKRIMETIVEVGRGLDGHVEA